MIKFAIVDDDITISSKINRTINIALAGIEIDYRVSIYNNAVEFVTSSELGSIDVVLLDIEIGIVNGIEVAKQIRNTNKNIIVIFISSFTHYLKDSFGLNVFGYIEKKNIDEELPRVLIRLLSELNNNYLISIIVDREQHILNINKIALVEYKERRLVVVTELETLLVSGVSLKEFYKKLNSHFIILNSNVIVNMNYISSIKRKKVLLRFFNKELDISIRNRKYIRDNFQQYLLSRSKVWGN